MPLSFARRTESGRPPVLRAAHLAVALSLQEADGMMNSEVRGGLQDAISAAHKGTGKYGSYVDHTGDEDSGDCIYQCNDYGTGDQSYMKAPYSKGTDESDDDYSLDTDNAVPVALQSSWEELPDDSDNYTKTSEAFIAAKVYSSMPLYERFIGKKERAAADSGAFAGKGKSFPILKPGDIMAAVHSMGRAGSENYSAATLKSNIIRIAKAKGWTSSLPAAWQSDDAKESRRAPASGDRIKLTESSAFTVDIPLKEAFKEGYKIKLISPGRGSTAFYTPEVLKQAANDKIFKAGTPMRIDHPTSAQEAERPEGSVKDWGAVLAKDAYWLDSGPAGDGLYSEVKPFSDHAATIDEKGPYAGVSICAYGDGLKEAGKPVMREGVPVLARFTAADGVDMVTRAGAGGMFLQEAARPIQHQEDSMEAAELKKLQESLATQAATNQRLLERAIRGDAREEATRILRTTSLMEAAWPRVIEQVTRDFSAIPQADGALDKTKFAEAVNAAAKTEGAYAQLLTGSGQVRGVGTPAPAELTAQESERVEKDAKKLRESRIANYMQFGLDRKAAEATVDHYTGQEAA